MFLLHLLKRSDLLLFWSFLTVSKEGLGLFFRQEEKQQ